MSRTTATFLTVVIGGGLLGCATVDTAPVVVAEPAPSHQVLRTRADAPSPKPTPRTKRASRSREVAAPMDSDGFTAADWASGSFARHVAQCESGGDPHVISHHSGVTYYGKWQANADFVRSYDGSSATSWVRAGRFTMPEARQDAMAFRGWFARGWQPWACAR